MTEKKKRNATSKKGVPPDIRLRARKLLAEMLENYPMLLHRMEARIGKLEESAGLPDLSEELEAIRAVVDRVIEQVALPDGDTLSASLARLDRKIAAVSGSMLEYINGHERAHTKLAGPGPELAARVERLETVTGPELAARVERLETVTGPDGWIAADLSVQGSQLLAFQQLSERWGKRLDDREREIGRLQALADGYKAAAQDWQKRADDLAGRLAELEDHAKTLAGDRDATLAELNRMRKANGIDRELLDRAQNELSELAGRIQTALDALEPDGEA